MPRNKVQQGLSWFSRDAHMMHEGKGGGRYESIRGFVYLFQMWEAV